MQGLLQDIKNQDFRQIYLLCGEEAYLRKQYKDRLRQALTQEGDTMNVHYFEGKTASAGEIIDLAETLPFFAPRRVIVVENSGWFSKGGEALADYLSNMPETTFLLLVESQVDKRTRLYKEVKKLGRITEFAPQDEETLKRWILGMLKKENKQITAASLQYLLNRTGTEMDQIKNEVEKLLCYTLGQSEITIEAINAVCTKRIQNQIFDMVEAIGKKEQKKALSLYYDLLTLKEPPMRILALVGRQFNYLLQIKELKSKGYSQSAMAAKTGLHGFVVGKYERQAARFKTAELKQALEACVEADEQVKRGLMPDVMSVELLLVQYSG
ncbi:MAG: DNA polymerase III subunit delta [Lachnospiraceae bacterium]|nr:DNA polymerase III subunit delta [Lachnospiraceae bacterium]